METFDYIIVGAGSAGCVLANRLTEDANCTVLLIEAGGSDRSLFIQMPSALSIPMNDTRYDWGYRSQPEPYMDNRSLHCPRGKVVGGSSSINGMVYVRGHACDFNEWHDRGATGWSYANCLPYFQRAETWIEGADDYRGGDGPLGVCNGNGMTFNPLYHAFIDAGRQAGYPATKDYNGHQQEGFGPMHMTVKNGVRCSTANAYFKPVAKRPNLNIVTHALVRKIILDGKRAVGVEYDRSRTPIRVTARREIILSAGAIGSPTILQRSGIGPGKVLQGAGVDVVQDLAGVGANLTDHLEVYLQYRCVQAVTLNGHLGLISKGLIGARWMLFRSGLGATNHFEACAFIRSRPGLKWPDLQYHFLPAAMSYDGKAIFPGHGFQVHVGPNKPKSRGQVAIRSSAAEDTPRILFNYLEHEEDRADWRRAIRLTREIIGQPAMDEFKGDEIQPSLAVSDDSDIDAWVRAKAESSYHPSCTCKMGAADDPLAVLDEACNVRAIANLRVVDASVFPTITNGNLNAPTIMVAERAADIIMGKQLLPGSDVSVWIDPAWSEQQRAGEPKRSWRDIQTIGKLRQRVCQRCEKESG